MSSLARTVESSLKEYRSIKAASHAIPRCTVFSDGVLRQLVTVRPTNRAELLTIKGLGDTRCEFYGEDILRLVRASIHAHSSSGLLTEKPKPVRHPERPKPKVIVRHPGDSTRPNQTHHHRRSHVNAKPKPRSTGVELVLLPPTKRSRAVLSLRPQAPDDEVYILELTQGKVYVGKSADVARRVGQHAAGMGAAWTKAYPPTGVLLPRLGNVRGSGDAAERDETLRYMLLRGVQNVRGWRYVAVNLTLAEQDDAEANIRELFDLCRRCGYSGHFQSSCKATWDRNGKPVVY